MEVFTLKKIKWRYPPNADVLYRTLPVTLPELLHQVREHSYALSDANEQHDDRSRDFCVEVLIHLYYRIYKLTGKENDHVRQYERKLPRMKWNAPPSGIPSTSIKHQSKAKVDTKRRTTTRQEEATSSILSPESQFQSNVLAQWINEKVCVAYHLVFGPEVNHNISVDEIKDRFRQQYLSRRRFQLVEGPIFNNDVENSTRTEILRRRALKHEYAKQRQVVLYVPPPQESPVEKDIPIGSILLHTWNSFVSTFTGCIRNSDQMCEQSSHAVHRIGAVEKQNHNKYHNPGVDQGTMHSRSNWHQSAEPPPAQKKLSDKIRSMHRTPTAYWEARK